MIARLQAEVKDLEQRLLEAMASPAPTQLASQSEDEQYQSNKRQRLSEDRPITVPFQSSSSYQADFQATLPCVCPQNATALFPNSPTRHRRQTHAISCLTELRARLPTLPACEQPDSITHTNYERQFDNLPEFHLCIDEVRDDCSLEGDSRCFVPSTPPELQGLSPSNDNVGGHNAVGDSQDEARMISHHQGAPENPQIEDKVTYSLGCPHLILDILLTPFYVEFVDLWYCRGFVN